MVSHLFAPSEKLRCEPDELFDRNDQEGFGSERTSDTTDANTETVTQPMASKERSATGDDLQIALEPDDDAAGDVTVTVPQTATDTEAAAIVAAIGAHVSDLERAAAVAAAEDATEEKWNGNRWAFAGRVSGENGWNGRVPTEVPTDPWTAAGRIGQF